MSEARIIDGKAFAANLRESLTRKADVLKKEHGLVPGLAVVLVGEDPASQVYVRNKGKQTVEVGYQSFEHKFDTTTPEADLLALVEKLNKDNAVHGILVQLPLPDHMDSQKVLDSINPAKDVDGFHAINIGRLWSGMDALVPCTTCQGSTPSSWAGPISSASPWRRFLSRKAVPSPSVIPALRICPPYAARPIFSWPPWAAPKWSEETGSSPAPPSSMWA
jgi:hypothetical protein